MKLNTLARSLALIGIGSQLAAMSGLAMAQTTPPATPPVQKVERVEVTGSAIKRIQDEGALPVQIITRDELDRAGIVSAEQLIDSLNINGNGMDNLASNSDVAAGAARGNNGVSAANLRGQGSAATLVLLNGRRVAAHGLNGGSVDLNSIPMAAVERIEVLKDGASSTYGTDAIGGVINFILKKSYTGMQASAFADMTEAGGGNIGRASLLAGFGDLDKNGFNVMASLSARQNTALNGIQRDFVNTFQVNRGLSVDTRGTPTATAFPIGATTTPFPNLLSNAAGTTTNGPIQPGTTQQMGGGINPLDLPGQAGCSSMFMGGPYDEQLWSVPSAKWACAYDTGRAAVLQQPVKSTSLVSRGTLKLGENHLLIGEILYGQSIANKKFSEAQITSSASPTSALYGVVWPSTGKNYDWVYDSIAAVFPSIAANKGLPIAFRWRCMECGRREIETTSDTGRAMLALEGSVGTWDYKAGISSAFSKSDSVLGGGFQYQTELMNLIKTGVLNPFLKPGETQTPAAMQALEAISAKGAELYGGKFKLQQADASASGPVFKLPAGDVYAAFGVDVRKESFIFGGDPRPLAQQRAIYLAPFDNSNLLINAVTRDIKAVYTEWMIPVTKSLEVTLATRRDDYSGFGSTNNPKISLRFAPVKELVFRGSYNTGFRVPTFNQIFNGLTDTFYAGLDLVDPAKCPANKVSTTPGCEAIRPNVYTGGKLDLGPEEAKQYTYGVVFSPTPNLVMNLDVWNINRTGTIQSLTLAQLTGNYALFSDRFIRDAAGNVAFIDQRWINAGENVTKGLEFGMRFNEKLGEGRIKTGIDISYLLEKKSRLIVGQPFGPSEVGVFSRSGDLGLRWKHTAFATYDIGSWTGTLYQVYRSGYLDAQLPGVANGTVKPVDLQTRVSDYMQHHVSVSYKGFKNISLTLGVKNIFNVDPPFSAAYDTNTGAGSSWDPRVGDPRGRAYTASATYTFW